MFTNWLTNSVPPTTTTASTTACSVLDEAAISGGTSAASAVALAAAANSTSSLMSTPPDVVLEVGPPPSVRFVAHSIVLGMHSGYLRSAIRLDEQINAAGHTTVSNAAASASAELVLYLTNVTAEQFAPLLTYMYTGYLDLNVDNIFVVLLATHVLHMPRALEICRSFLSRAQSEGYLGNNLPPMSAPCNSGKIIRPIPSKATLPNFGFMPAAPMSQHHLAALPPTPASDPYKTLPHHSGGAYQSLAVTTSHTLAASAVDATVKTTNQQEVSASTSTITPDNGSNNNNLDDDDDDEEVFIDTNDDSMASPEIDCNISVTSSKDIEIEKDVLDVCDATVDSLKIACSAQKPSSDNNNGASKPPTNARCLAKREKLRQSRSNKQSRRQKSPAANGGLQIAKAPILASELDMERPVTSVQATESSKFIVDVASCDGPVRFRRILNTAYGHKPDSALYANVLPTGRTQQSVSLSFHQQMAKTISQQRHLQHAEESENSESSGSQGAVAGINSAGGSSKSNASTAKTSNNEIYVCVYCKHSFKSQYCYQKHAKRHLNPLSLNCAKASLESGSNTKEVGSSCEQANYRQSASSTSYTSRLPQPAAASELLRREVRPLDMNVQYYPCKTCGSKFPSYYFVHKHRKLCHADEEAQESEARRSASSGNGGGGGGGNTGSGGTQKKLD